MKKKKCIVSVHLKGTARAIYEEMSRHMPYGWFSRFVSEKLSEIQPLNEEAIKMCLIWRDEDRKKIDNEIQKLAEQLKKIKKRRREKNGRTKTT